MAITDVTREAVLAAMAEFRRLGRRAFLKTHGFGKARDYVIFDGGHEYDSKAVVGVAHGYLPGRAVLPAETFTGGLTTVVPALRRLGFMIIGPDDLQVPTAGDVLTNDEIVRRFVVGNQGGMRWSSKHSLLLIVSDPFKGLYEDRWDGDVLHYTGMGAVGDQQMIIQNRRLSQSTATGIPVHLMEVRDPERYTYLGLVDLAANPYQGRQPDKNGNDRAVWMFPVRLRSGAIRPPLTAEQEREIEDRHATMARRLSMEELRRRAKAAGKVRVVRTVVGVVEAIARNAAVAEYTRRCADGVCDLCGARAPFNKRLGEPYLECHHVVWLARDGDDTIANTVALCPNCHRKMHVLNAKADRDRLAKVGSERAAAAEQE